MSSASPRVSAPPTPLGDQSWWRGFARWAAGPIQAPQAVRARAVDAFIDTVACIIGGWDAPAARAARAVAGPTPGDRAFALAAAAHALDYDDYSAPSIGHPSAVMVPVVLAHPDLTGHAAIDAFLVGVEAMDRLGEAANPDHYEGGWHATATLGAVGAAAAAGRALGLDPERMLAAVSIAAGAAGGLKAQFGTGAKPVNVGLGARTGVTAAHLAAQGLDARAETPEAFAALTGGGRAPSGPPGSPFLIETHGLIAKRWPCCGYLSRIVDTLTEIAAAPGFDAGAVREVILRAPPRAAAILRYDRPRTPDEARFSPPYCAAAALIGGGLTIADFTDEAIRRADVLALAERVSFSAFAEARSEIDLSPEDPDEVIVVTEGARIERTARIMKGGPEDPMTRADFAAKLAACAPGPTDQLFEALATMETAPTLSAILERMPR